MVLIDLLPQRVDAGDGARPPKHQRQVPIEGQRGARRVRRGEGAVEPPVVRSPRVGGPVLQAILALEVAPRPVAAVGGVDGQQLPRRPPAGAGRYAAALSLQLCRQYARTGIGSEFISTSLRGIPCEFSGAALSRLLGRR